MNKQLVIKHEQGHMTINLEKFFPTNQKDCKRVLSTINLNWKHREELVATLVNWMKEEIIECSENSKIYANLYVDVKPKVREAEIRYLGLKASIEKNKTWQKVCPVEYNQLKEKMKKANDEFKRLKSLERFYHSSFNNYHNRKEKLQKNLEFYEKG